MSDVVAAILSAGWPLGIAAGLAALGMGIAAGKALRPFLVSLMHLET